MNYDVIVIGGGPAGMFAALTAKKYSEKVLLIEKNNELGKKLLITGGGRCNFTNTATQDKFIANIPGNGRFLYSILNQFSNTDLINFVENNLKIQTMIEDDGRVFPISNKANSLVNSLKNYLIENNVEIIYECILEKIIIDNSKIVGILINNNRVIKGRTVILATGGISYPMTGSTGDGYQIVEKLGHLINEVFPSSVPLLSEDLFITNKELQGISLKDVKLYLYDENNKCVNKTAGDIIFTHYGLSGPAILKISRYVAISNKKELKTNFKLKLDIFPDKSEEELFSRIEALITNNRGKNIYNGFKDLLPEKLLNYIIKINDIRTNKMNEISVVDIKKIINSMKNFIIFISGTRSIDEAIVTGGGIDIKQINPKTLESKLINGLFFAGEVLDVDANTGGYNLQIAFSTGYVAGKSASKFILDNIEL